MAFRSGSQFWILSLWVGVLLWECCLVSTAPVAAESESNSVEIKFYLMKPSEWTEVEEDFKEVIAKSLTTYCKVNYEQCGLRNWADSYQFSSAEVVVSKVEDLKNYLNITYFVNFNDNVKNNTSSVVKKAALLESLTESRKDVNDCTGSEIISIGQDEYSPEPTKRLNEIIIPVVVAVFFILVIITVALYYWRKNQDQKEKRHQINELRKSKRYKKKRNQQREDPASASGTRSTTRVGPSPGGSTNTEPHQANGHHKRLAHRDDDDSYHGNQTEDTILNTTDSLHRNMGLPPLEGNVKSEKKKSKRHKRHQKEKKSEGDEPHYYETNDNTETDGIRHGSYHQVGQALPPPPEYTRRYYDDEYHSDRSDDLSTKIPPV